MPPLSTWNGRCPKESPSPKGTCWLLSPDVASMHRQIGAARRGYTSKQNVQKPTSEKSSSGATCNAPPVTSPLPKAINVPSSDEKIKTATDKLSCFSPRRRARLLTSAGRLPIPVSPRTAPKEQSHQQSFSLMKASLVNNSPPHPSPIATANTSSPESRWARPHTPLKHEREFARLRGLPRSQRHRVSLTQFVCGLCILLLLVLVTGMWTALVTAALSESHLPPVHSSLFDGLASDQHKPRIQVREQVPMLPTPPPPSKHCRWSWRRFRCTGNKNCTIRWFEKISRPISCGLKV